ncbi:MAG: hypothetical protein HOO06_07350 [Bdellovibrionaceae bacterium]|jgi:hypothetical protein|nr:hypothetical protein [Pseudobdellovibrionaceae bacterium]
MIKKIFLICLLFVGGFSCATHTGKQHKDITIKKHDGLRIYFYRNPGMWGVASKTSVIVDKNNIVTFSNGMFTHVDLPRGHQYNLIVTNLLDSLRHEGNIKIDSQGKVFLRVKTNSAVEEIKASSWAATLFGPVVTGKVKYEYQPKKIKDGLSYYLFDVVNPESALNEIKINKLKFVEAKVIPSKNISK